MRVASACERWSQRLLSPYPLPRLSPDSNIYSTNLTDGARHQRYLMNKENWKSISNNNNLHAQAAYANRRSLTVKKIAAITLDPTLIIGGMFLSTGCERQGPAEQAGREVDQAVEKMKDVVSPPGPAETVGKEFDRAVADQTK
jgi:hypothetical protein